MDKEDEMKILAAIDGKDVSDVMPLLIMRGNSYSRRMLKVIRWVTKWVPVAIMMWHAFAMLDFSRNPREMFVVHAEHWPSYAFIYVMLYVLPMVLIVLSRFFWLCWVYRIPFFYYFGVNAVHVTYGSWYTTNEMVMSCMTVIVMTGVFYGYWVVDFTMRKKGVFGRG